MIKVLILKGHDLRMNDQTKTNTELIEENALLKQRIQELEKSESDLKESEYRFRVVRDISMEAFTILRCIRDAQVIITDFIWTYANPAAGRILKQPHEKLIGQRLLEVLPGNRENRDLFDRYVRIGETGLGDEVELEYRSGEISGWFRNMTVKLGDGVAVSFSDITRRKQAEEILQQSKSELDRLVTERTAELNKANAQLQSKIVEHKQTELKLKETEEKYRNIFENSAEGIYQVAPDGRFITANPAAAHILGYDSSEELVSTITDIGSQIYAYPEDRAKALELLRKDGFFKNFEVRNRQKNGNIVWVMANVHVVRDDQGNILHHEGTSRDITERKRAEEALQESEDKLRSIVDASPVPLALNDEQGNITYLNPAFLNTFGYDMNDIPTLAQWWSKAYPDPAYRNLVTANWQLRLDRVSSEGASFEPSEINIRCKNGSQRTVLDGAASLSGVFDGTHLVTLYDITDRKKMEEVLRKNREDLRDAHHLAHIGVWNWIAETDTVIWSDELYIIVGLDPNSPAPTYAEHSNIYAPESWNRLKSAVEKALETGTSYQLELKLIRPDGNTRIVNAFGGAKYDTNGQISGLYGTVQDITERKRVEEALRESEERYRTLVENASDIVFRTDENGYFTFVNPSTLRISGYEEGEIIGKHYKMFIRTDMFKEAITSFANQLIKKIQNTYTEYPILTKKGHEVWLGQNTQLIIKEDHVTGFQAVARDITERKRMEKELSDSERRYRDLSIIDDLTQLYNARYFYHQLKLEIDRVNRYEKQPMTLLFLDLDNFKQFNDIYGHVEGDQVLSRLGQVVKRCLRQTDSAYRYGGE